VLLINHELDNREIVLYLWGGPPDPSTLVSHFSLKDRYFQPL